MLTNGTSDAVACSTGVSRSRRLDVESQAWIDRLSAAGRERDAGIDDLHALLLKAARFEIDRRRAVFPHLRGNDYDDLAQQSADDALVAVLSKLDDFRGDSRFTTWAYKFALLEAGVKVRRRAWQGREVPLEPEGWALIAEDRSTPHQDVEGARGLRNLRTRAARLDWGRHRPEMVSSCQRRTAVPAREWRA